MCNRHCNYTVIEIILLVLFYRYFETFDAITDVDVTDRLKMMNLVRKCSSKDEVGVSSCHGAIIIVVTL